MHTTVDKTSTMLLLPPIPTDTFTKAVPDLITFFEGLDTTIEELSSSSSSPSSSPTVMSRIPAPFPTPFTALRLSLTTSFNHPKRLHTTQSSTDSTTTSASTSPQSTFRGAAFSRSRTWNSTRTRSRSPRSMHSYSSSPVLLSRRPSATDLALLEEDALSHNVRGVGLGLGLMEPRPVVPVAVAVSSAASSIFEGVGEDEAEVRQPFVMGGILEVMEGRS